MDSRTAVIERRVVCPTILPETILLALICFADMIQTIIVVKSGIAIEANPMLAAAMVYSPWAFALVKSTSFLVPLTAVEILRPLSPTFVRISLRLGSLGYLFVYLVGTLQINHLLPAIR